MTNSTKTTKNTANNALFTTINSGLTAYYTGGVASDELTNAIYELSHIAVISTFKKCVQHIQYDGVGLEKSPSEIQDVANMPLYRMRNEYNASIRKITTMHNGEYVRHWESVTMIDDSEGLDLLQAAVVATYTESKKQFDKMRRVDIEKAYTDTITKKVAYGKTKTVDTEIVPIKRIFKAVRGEIYANKAIESPNDFQYITFDSKEEEIETYTFGHGFTIPYTQQLKAPSTENIVVNGINYNNISLTSNGTPLLSLSVSDSDALENYKKEYDSYMSLEKRIKEKITDRQKEVLDLLLKGYSHRDIANTLKIGVSSVQNDIKNIRKATFEILKIESKGIELQEISNQPIDYEKTLKAYRDAKTKKVKK